MATTTIPWGDGSGDNIYLTYSSASGNQAVEVTSDANTGFPRAKEVTFATSIGSASETLLVNQGAGDVLHKFSVLASSYDTNDYSYAGLSNIARAYRDPDENADVAAITLTKGEGADTWIYFKFDTSSIPANANIVTVTCRAKVSISTTDSSIVAVKGCKLCSGTTEKTGSVSVTGTLTIRTFMPTLWTREEVNDVRLKMYATRGSSSTTSNAALRIAGAELIVTYTLVPAITSILEVNPYAYTDRDEGGVYYGVADAENAYDDEDNSSYATIRLTRGTEGAVTSVYFKFNTSSIPSDALIVSAHCRAKAYVSNRTSTNVAVHECQMFSDTTAKGSSSDITGSSAAVYSMDMDDDWSIEEIRKVRIRFYAERGTANLNSDYSFRFYGATLTVFYVTKQTN